MRSPLEQAEHEEEIADWLADHGVNAEASEALADSGVSIPALDRLASSVQGAALEAARKRVGEFFAKHTPN